MQRIPRFHEFTMELPAQQICLSMGIPKGIEDLAPLLSPGFRFCARDIVGLGRSCGREV